MCVTCGCSVAGVTVTTAAGSPVRLNDESKPTPCQAASFRATDVHTHTVAVEQAILGENARYAQRNRHGFALRGVLAINLMSSPGSGKTTLLVRTIAALHNRVSVAVIEGDQQTERDAERIRATGAPVVQINTDKGCHLDARMIQQALVCLEVPVNSVLFIENVGNLVCPAAFDLGEQFKVVILSVTEGDDKPLKYPSMFATADLMILNKTDLLPHVSFDVDQCIAYARRINPRIEVVTLSAATGAGMDEWLAWVERARAGVSQPSTLEPGMHVAGV